MVSAVSKTDAEPHKPGKNKAGKESRARIFCSAEKLFAESGYDGTSVRRIALDAEVPVALISYHFGNKEGLYRALFEERLPTLMGLRLSGLDLADQETDPERRIEMTIRAVILPMLKMRADEQSHHFGKIMARGAAEQTPLNEDITARLMDPIADRVLKSLAECLPTRPAAEIHWAYHMMIGTMVFVMSDSGRIARLSPGICEPNDYQAASAHVVSLIVAALKHGSLGRT